MTIEDMIKDAADEARMARIIAEARPDKPRRYQLSRLKGSRLPPGVICCTRPGPWGNPFKTVEEFRRLIEAILGVSGQSEFHAIELGEFSRAYWIATHLGQLRGKSLACWCALDMPCHVDVLLEFANRDAMEGGR